MPKVYMFFGPPSSGKSFLGKKFAEQEGFTFYEADDDYLPEYRERVSISEEEKQKVYDEFYTTVISKINKLLEQEIPVVVASAIGKNKNRKKFIDKFGSDILFILIKSEHNVLIENAIKREFPRLKGNNLSKEEESSLREHLIKKISKFEIPDFEHLVIENDYTQNTIAKLHDIV